MILLLYLTLFIMRDLREETRVHYSELQKIVALQRVDVEDRAERGEISFYLAKKRLELRAFLEESEDDLNYLAKFIRSDKSANLLLSNSWLRIEEDLKRTH